MAVVAVLRALGLGDCCTAVPALRGLARAFPDHRRVLAAPAWLVPLVDRAATGFEVIDCDLRGAASPFPPLPSVFDGADVAVNLHGRGPQSTAALLASRPGRLLSFGEAGCPSWAPGEHEVQRWCRLLGAAGIPADPDDLDIDVTEDATLVPVADRGATILHPGAASGARRWPVQRWAAVARAEQAAGHRVLITGSSSERRIAERVAATAGLDAGAVRAGRTSLPALAGLLATAGRVVCGDTGVAHLATAVRAPSVVLFGPTAPAEWGPPAHRSWHRALWAGRYGDPHAEVADPGLLRISVDDVLAALADLPTAQEADGAGARCTTLTTVTSSSSSGP